MEKEKAVLSWSSGKDSALSLFRSLPLYSIEKLLTTVSKDFKRVSMHGVREDLLIKQSEALGIPIDIVYLDNPCSNKKYNEIMNEKMGEYKAQGINKIIFGDIFLENLRNWREKNLSILGMKAVFPLWQIGTDRIARNFIESGFKAVVTCVTDAHLSKLDTGVQYDMKFIQSLPKKVDPCGENGEFHTFVYEGPIFKNELKIELGEKIYRPLDNKIKCDLKKSHDVDNDKYITNGHWFCDVLSKS